MISTTNKVLLIGFAVLATVLLAYFAFKLKEDQPHTFISPATQYNAEKTAELKNRVSKLENDLAELPTPELIRTTAKAPNARAQAAVASGVDYALNHTHTGSATFDGLWVKRMTLEAKDAQKYPLGNAVAIRNSANSELWFFKYFQPGDGPMIQMFESRAQGAQVRVTYDPACFGVISFKDLNPPAVTPSPTPTPLPVAVKPPLKPCAVGEFCYFAWPTVQADRMLALNNVVAYGCDGQSVVQTGSYIYCQRTR